MKFFLSVFLFLSSSYLVAQYVPGDSYFGENNYIEYIAGNLPIVISIPHGGYLEPEEIPDRNCNDCVYYNDAYTQELGLEIQQEIFNKTGSYPHLIINKLDRKKLDANREVNEAADGNQLAETAWLNFYSFIDTAKNEIIRKFGKGLYIDLHGHGHTIQQIEIGYLLYEDELTLSDNTLNTATYINYSSIKKLAKENQNNYSHAELLRGEKSFGSLLYLGGYPSVPSQYKPFPLENEPYFSGGYNLAQHSSYNGGSIDGLQIECNKDIRYNPTTRLQFARIMASSILDFLKIHYFNNLEDYYIQTNSTNLYLNNNNQITVFPNPFHDYISFVSDEDIELIKIISIDGIEVFALNPKNSLNKVNLSFLKTGLYNIYFYTPYKVYIFKIIKI